MLTPRKALALGLASAATVGVLSVGLVSASPGVAFAADSTSSTSVPAKGANLAQLQQKGEAAIDKRLTDIPKLQASVAAASNMTAAHKSTLNALLASDTTNLTALRAKIAADTDTKTCRADDMSIVTDYRIYLLVGPKVHVTRAADDITAVSSKEGQEITLLTAQAARLQAAGKDVTSLNQFIGTATSQSHAGAQAVAGQGDIILSLQPQGYPGNSNQVDTAKAAVKTGAADVKNARQALKQAEAIVKQLNGKSTGATTSTTVAASAANANALPTDLVVLPTIPANK